jgi:inhibitor of cysteine peptidase
LSILTIAEGDNGRVVMVKPGDRIIIDLPENASTGYRWEIAQRASRCVLSVDGEETRVPAGAGIGAGGSRVFSLRADAPGQSVICAELRRPWETGRPPERRFELTVEVTA